MSRQTATFKAKDKEWTLTALDFGDWKSFRKYVQYREYYRLKEEAKEFPELNEYAKEKLIECHKREVSMKDLSNVLQEFVWDVLIELVYLSMRHCHQSITRDEVEKLVDVESIQDVIVRIMTISGVQDDGKEDDPKNVEGQAVEK